MITSTRTLARLLIDARRAEVHHALDSVSPWWLVTAGAVALVGAFGTLVLGAVSYRRPGAGADVLAFVLALWSAGRVAQAAVSGGGGGALSPEVFRLLPLPRRRLASALLIVGMADPSLVICALAFAGLVAYGARQSPAAAGVALLAAVLLLTAVAIASSVAAGAAAPGTRRGRDAGTLIIGLIIAAVGTVGSLVPILTPVLSGRRSPALVAVVRWLPTGWAPVAVDAAGRDQWWLTVVALSAIAALTAALVAVWPWLLSRRMDARAQPLHHGGTDHWRILPATPVWAVAAKEVRLWTREQIRLICGIVAVFFGVWPCVISRLAAGHSTLMPFGGAMTALLAGACAVNLYGGDGRSLWCTVMTPRAATADCWGRQLGWLLVFGPYVTVLTVALTAASGQRWAWPWVLSGVPALLGGGAALASLGSLIAVIPMAPDGGPTPGWSVKIHLALLAGVVPVLPPVAFLVADRITGIAALQWLAIPVGVATGVALFVGFGRAATRRLVSHQVEILTVVGAGGP